MIALESWIAYSFSPVFTTRTGIMAIDVIGRMMCLYTVSDGSTRYGYLMNMS